MPKQTNSNETFWVIFKQSTVSKIKISKNDCYFWRENSNEIFFKGLPLIFFQKLENADFFFFLYA